MSRWKLEAGRTFYLDGKPAFYIHRIVDDRTSNAVLTPWGTDKITHVIERCLKNSKSRDRFGSCCMPGKRRRRRRR